MSNHVEGQDVPLVDLRGLDPPEPMTRILALLDDPGPMRFLLSRAPLPLYPMLRLEGWRYSIEARPDGVELRIERRKAVGSTIQEE